MASHSNISSHSYMFPDLLPYQHLVEEKDREPLRELALEIFSDWLGELEKAEQLSVEETLKELGMDPSLGRKINKDDLYWTGAEFLIASKKLVKKRYENVDVNPRGHAFNPEVEYVIRKSGEVIRLPSWQVPDESFLFAYLEISGIAKKN